MIESGLPPSFWAEAVSTANYIRNRCPTKTLNGRTPFELWHGKAPNISHFKEFGSKVIILNRHPGRGKIDDRGKNGIFVGYDTKSKGYRIWIPEERVIQRETSNSFKILKILQPETTKNSLQKTSRIRMTQ